MEAATPPPARNARRAQHANRDSMPKAIEDRFIRVRNTYYYPNGNEAFRDHGKKVTTTSENAELARLLIEIALHRGYTEVRVSGTERFKRQIWRAAFRAGVEVRGYKPSEVEKVRAVRELARQKTDARAQPRPLEAESDLRREPAEPILPRAQEGATRAAVDTGAVPVHEHRSAILTGRLLSHGDAPYRHTPDGGPSYFLKLKTDRGERTIWGTDLKRALEQSETKPKIGDQIGVRTIGREPVTFTKKTRDAAGHVIDESLTAHRNSWVVEKADHFDRRRRASEALLDTRREPKVAVQEHPELIGSYVSLRAAELLAEKHIVSPGDRRAFLNAVREKIARQIASGGRLPSVKIRERTPARDTPGSTSRERDAERVPA